MSNKKQETIADIVREMRQRFEPYAKSDSNDARYVAYLLYAEFADRIEAAAKREREAGAEAAQICGEFGEMVGREAACHKPVTDCHGLNAAAMREACANIAEYAKTAACHTEDAHLLGYLNQIERWAEAALSAPPRNCDVLEGSTADDEFEKEMGFPPSKTADERDEIMRENWFLFKHWLFAEAKGE